ncbi:MAG TPA: CHRD domain-containing protein [Chloroflexota bacterium]|nr:CHRD domain-containing protein [Chloroflexota bacterium]
MSRLRTAVFAPIGVLALLASFAVPNLVDAKTSHERFSATLSGAQEVPPRTTSASGRGRTDLRDGNELRFDVQVRDIENVVVSHIHAGAPGVNGPVCVTLYGPVPPGGGRENGLLANGTATALDPNVLQDNPPGVLAQCGGSFAGFLALHRAGNTYINVHTNDGDATPNEGPGDFPGGELRGQLLPRD